ncbi:MAG: class C beta-lactamase [Pseudomonas sp.]|uniref:class C beta-lactamase n=1 Tax=Pseudomonas sp. TaxID=306 RepID=UPI003D0DF146
MLGNASAESRDLTATVNATIEPLMQAHGIPGMAVAITRNGHGQAFYYGLANLESGQAVSAETLFEIGSVSKTLTATLAALAQEKGKLSLPEKVERYVPELQGSPLAQVTLLDLGLYTAGGLPLQFPDSVSDRESMVAYYRQWQPEHQPGSSRRYSNPSIGLLGYIAAQRLEAPFASVMETQLLPSLGMSHSYIQVPPAQMPHYAYGYTQDNQPVRVNPGPLDGEAYGVKTTAADLLRFVHANLQPGALEGPLKGAIATTQRGYYQVGDMTQGLGWEFYPYPITVERLQAGNSSAMALEAHPVGEPQVQTGDVLFNKTGSTGGFGAYVAFIPARGLGVVLLANKNYPNAARVEAAHALLTALDKPAQ